MSAREKAVEAMWLRSSQSEPIGMSSLGMLLDAIPAEVLAQLAVDRGGLVQVGWQGAYADFFALSDDPEDHADDLADANLRPIYRLGAVLL